MKEVYNQMVMYHKGAMFKKEIVESVSPLINVAEFNYRVLRETLKDTYETLRDNGVERSLV